MADSNTDLPPAPPGYTAQVSDGLPKPELVYSPHPQPAYSQQPSYVTPLERLQDTPEWVDCPFCRKVTKTRVSQEDSTVTIIAGAALCLVCICLACLPCMLGWAQNTDHYCTTCNRQLTHRPHDGMTMIAPAARDAQVKTTNGGPMPGQVMSSFAPRPDDGNQHLSQAPQNTP